jgi:RHS repeat-associated protein
MKVANSIIALMLVSVLGVSPVLTFTKPKEASRSSVLPGRRMRPATKTRPGAPRPVQTPALLEGQTSTSLPDGGLLITGGMDQVGPTHSVKVFNPRTGKSKSLPDMALARAFHSATILPDGRVFVFGGVGKNQRVLNTGMVVDPVTGESENVLARSGLSPRAYHTTSLLTDGRVLIVGGRSERLIESSQIWDYRTLTTEAAGTLSVAREKHAATLLADGNVLIEGGVDEAGNEIKAAELFNVEAKSFSFTTISAEQNERPFLAASIPAANAVEIPVDTKVALRFSQRLPLEAIKQAIKFETLQEGVAVKIVPAENGRLVFINPLEDLRTGTAYQVSVVEPADGSLTITPASVSFTTVTDKELTSRGGADLDWTPDAESMRGNWQTKLGKSSWEDQPPLEANSGETALAGRVLTLTGQPLSDVTISVKDVSTRTDGSGRFLLRAPDGHHVMLIDGRTANRPGRTYGTFRASVNISFGKTNVLDYTIWMPKLDMAHAVTIPSPNSKEIVITNPSIPGLELHLPPGTVIRDIDGKTVTQLSITPIPTDRPPFPLPPGLKVPVFASIQPGGAQVIPPRARLIYPNYNNEAPGKRINFWNYDPDEKGWHIYGQGTVTANGRQIVPDPGVVIYEFSGIMISDAGFPPLFGREPGDDDEDGDPVDLSTGLFVLEKTDLVLPDTIPILLNRAYRPGDSTSRAFGVGASHPYEMFLWSDNNYQETDLILPDGSRIHYERVSPGTVWWDAIYEHTESPSAFYKSQIYWNGTGWDLRLTDGTVFVFPEYSPLQSIRDRYGNELTVTRAFGVIGNITQLTSPNGRWIQFTYGSGDRISQARDNSGRTVNYTYDSSGRLWKVTDVNGGVTEYLYDISHRMLSIKDPRGITYLNNEYDSNSRVIRQTQADSSVYEFDYTLNGSGKVTQTEITDPRGNVRQVTFNSDGYTLTDTVAVGTAIEQTFTYTRQSGSNLIVTETDPLARQTAYTYDSFSNVTSVTLLATTGNAVTTNLTYEPNFQQIATITDPLNHTTTYAYDVKGNLTSVTDALNHQITFTYNTAGQVTSVTDPLNNTTQLIYDSGDLATVTNPLGHSTSRYTDIIGRGLVTTDGAGATTTFEYNAANLPTQVTDSRGGISTFEYDANGNLLNVTDANNHETTFIYDNMDRMEVRTDPLARSESYEYDDGGNVTKFTDRRGKVTTFTYDALDRVTFAGYGTVVNGGSTTYESTVTYSYDAVGRLSQFVDSQTGTITFAYDGFDRLTSETSPRGTVSYTYDTAGRPASMTVTGRTAVNYTYDNADRLTGITQGSSSATYAYDAANRRTSLTLPNGLVTEHGYDVGSNVTSITYKQGSTVLGDLTYEYDASRRRTKTSGSYARTGLPSALSSVTYDAANQLTQHASTNLTYDSNGNLTSDGVNTYTWDARNQLSAISGGMSASFAYDPMGRRTSKTASGQTTEYLYDGLDIVQELSGGTPNADMLNGADIDERLTCNCNGAPRTLLSDALKSTVALSNSSGTIETDYTYNPFGAVTSSGTTSSNASQFTGRENDSTGLHYYRARYYSPVHQRFISEDPLGFGGGDSNFYAYVANSPTNLTDPTGTNPLAAAAVLCLEGAIIGAATDAVMDSLLGRKITLSGLGRSAISGCVGSLIGFGLGKAFKMARGLGRSPRPPRTPPMKPNRQCFVAGTMVTTADGEKRIEDISVGDIVLSAEPSLDEQAAPPIEAVVVRTFVREAPEVLDIRVRNETITATPEHPFWVVDQGWTAAGELRPGSELLTKDGLVVHVNSIESRRGSFKVYNFEVAGSHTYFVSPLGLLVHNQCLLSERAARREAFRKNNVPTSKPNNYTREPVYGKNQNLKGSKGQPSEVIKTTDVNGKPVTIQNHKNGHVFRDVNPPVVEGPHYLGPDGKNIFYRP